MGGQDCNRTSCAAISNRSTQPYCFALNPSNGREQPQNQRAMKSQILITDAAAVLGKRYVGCLPRAYIESSCGLLSLLLAKLVPSNNGEA